MRTPDRRSHIRHPGEHIKVLVRSLNPDNTDWIKGLIYTVDFNRYGIGIETSHRFAMGEKVALIIRTDDSALAELNGVVCNRYKSDIGFRCGIQFQIDEAKLQLIEIEQQAAPSIR